MHRVWTLITISISAIANALNSANQYMIHYDLTKDGKIDSRELRTVAYMDYKLPPTISDDILRKTDRDGDDLIDRNEITEAVSQVEKHVAQATQRWLQDHDTDGDGQLSEHELFESVYMEHGLPSTNVSVCFRKNDANSDGFLTSKELIEMLHCIRSLALKEGKRIMKIYDTDGDHKLNIREAQMLADLRYDIGPDYAAYVFESVSHRSDKTINEIEIVDLLTELRLEAAVVALDKLSSLDQNGDEAVSFSELLQGYEKQLKKIVLKKIFSDVDVNKNAHIDPIEFVSLQNLLADEIRLQAIQEDLKQRYRVTKTTTTPPTLIIFTHRKEPHKWRMPKRRIRRSNSENDKNVVSIDDASEMGSKKAVISDADNIMFSSTVTAVPRFLIPNEEDRKFLFDGAKLIAEKFAGDKKSKSDKVKLKTDDNILMTEDNAEAMQALIENNSEYNSDRMHVNIESTTVIDENGYARDQNRAIINDPKLAYIKKFEKFFDFLQTTIKKVVNIVKEKDEDDAEGLRNFVKDINIIRRENATDVITNVTNLLDDPTETSVPEIIIRENSDEELHKKIENQSNLIVKLNGDPSKLGIGDFKGNAEDQTLKLEKQSSKEAEKMKTETTNHRRTGRKGTNHSSEVRRDLKRLNDSLSENKSLKEKHRESKIKLLSELSSPMYQNEKSNKFELTTSAPLHKTTVEPPPESQNKLEGRKLYFDSDKYKIWGKNDDISKENNPKMQNVMDFSKYKSDYTKRYKADIRTPESSQEFATSENMISHEHNSRFHNDKKDSGADNEKTAKNIADNDCDESEEVTEQKLFAKNSAFDESVKRKSQPSTEHAESDENSTKKSSTEKRDYENLTENRSDNNSNTEHSEKIHSEHTSTKFEMDTTQMTTEEAFHKTTVMEEDRPKNESEILLNIQMGNETDGNNTTEKHKPLVETDKRITNEDGWEVHSLVNLDDFELLPVRRAPAIQIANTPSSSEEDDFLDVELTDLLNETLSDTNQTISVSEGTKATETTSTSAASTTIQMPSQSSEIATKSSTVAATSTHFPESSIKLNLESTTVMIQAEPTTNSVPLTELAEVIESGTTAGTETDRTSELSTKIEQLTESENKTDRAVVPSRGDEAPQKSSIEAHETTNDDRKDMKIINSTKNDSSQRKRKKCLRHHHPIERKKCLVKQHRRPEKTILIEITIPATNATAVVREKKCRMRKKYRPKTCQKSQKHTDLKSSMEPLGKLNPADEKSSEEAKTVDLEGVLNSNGKEFEESAEQRQATLEGMLTELLREYQMQLEEREKNQQNIDRLSKKPNS